MFRCIPTDQVQTFADMRNYLKSQLPLAFTDPISAKQQLTSLQGHLVLVPLNFLDKEKLSPSVLSKEGMAPTLLWT